MLKQRLITALILLVLFLAALFGLPAMGWGVLVLGMVMLGISEWARLAQLPRHYANLYWWVTLPAMTGLTYFAVSGAALSRPAHLFFYGVSGVLWLLVPLWLKHGWQVRNPVVMALVGWALLIPTGLAMMDLRAQSPWLLLGVMALVWIADSAAFFAGRKFGKHKLAPGISPGKTWEGVMGAMLGVSLYVVLVAIVGGLVQGFPRVLMLVSVSWLWVALSVIGDLFESAIKRQAGVKDSGTLLPGHGGLLDRIDALTSTLPLAALVLLLKGSVWAA